MIFELRNGLDFDWRQASLSRLSGLMRWKWSLKYFSLALVNEVNFSCCPSIELINIFYCNFLAEHRLGSDAGLSAKPCESGAAMALSRKISRRNLKIMSRNRGHQASLINLTKKDFNEPRSLNFFRMLEIFTTMWSYRSPCMTTKDTVKIWVSICHDLMDSQSALASGISFHYLWPCLTRKVAQFLTKK